MSAINYYPFELHCHTVHSDGKFTPYELVRAAKDNGLAGIALTDHNTCGGVYEAIAAGKELGIVVIPGIEWTTFYGHITVLGGHSDVDWRTVNPDSVCDKLEAVRAAGDISVLAHPYRVGYPVCTGGRAEFGRDIFKLLDGYEVYSSELDDPTNLSSLSEYLDLCKRGFRLAAVYGRDWHRSAPNVGFGLTLLGIEGDLTAENAIEAIRNGRTSVADYDGKILLSTPRLDGDRRA